MTEHVEVENDGVLVMRKVILSIDLMYFAGLTLLITVSRGIHFITATLLQDRRKQMILEAIKQVKNLYKGHGHNMSTIEFDFQSNPIHMILADNEFQSLKEALEGTVVNVNLVPKDEHVPEVERQNRVIKERARAIVQTLPYHRMPKRMRAAMLQYVVYWLNTFPHKGQDISPRMMIMGEQKMDYKKICKVPFRAYVQAHNDNQITNTM